MKVLFIGGSGNISRACTQKALDKGMDVFHLNRGRSENPFKEKINVIKADMNDPAAVNQGLKNHFFDVIVNFIAYLPSEIDRDFELFRNKTNQYVFISSA